MVVCMSLALNQKLKVTKPSEEAVSRVTQAES